MDMSQFRFIPGAPSGVCAKLIPAQYGLGNLCEECKQPIKEDDGDIWYCSYSWLGKRGKQKLNPKSGCAHWHYNCLEPAPPSVAGLTVQ